MSDSPFGLAPGVALGLDWSGAQDAGRKIWAARLVVDGHTASVESVERPFARGGRALPIVDIVDELAPWLEGQTFDVAGLDFCFGLAEEAMTRLGLPRSGPAAVGTTLRATFGQNADAFRAAAAPELRRQTDAKRRAPFAPTNLRMYRQTFWGLCALSTLTSPVPPWRPGGRAVVEILPADVGRAIGATDKTSVEGRRHAVDLLALNGIEMDDRDRDTIVRDADGDALDAVLAAVAASGARSTGFAGAPSTAASSGEGWIYSLS